MANTFQMQRVHAPAGKTRMPSSLHLKAAAQRGAPRAASLLSRQVPSSPSPTQLRSHLSVVTRASSSAASPGQPGGEEFDANNKRYAELTAAIETAAAAAQEGLQGTSVYLVGMMGSGKTTVGKLISQALGYCYFDTDALIEQLAGKTIPEIFADDGEDDFRAIETQVLQELAPFKNCIISTGGGAPTKGVNWGHMQGGISVFLNGSPALLARRVMRDGTENRPLLADSALKTEKTGKNDKNEAVKSGTGFGGGGGAESSDDKSESGKENNSSNKTNGGSEVVGSAEFDALVGKLSALLEDRKEQYTFADITVSLAGEDVAAGAGAAADFGAPPAVVAHRVLLALMQRISQDSAMREERKNFEVVNETLPESMRVVQSINKTTTDPDPYLP